MPTVSLTFIGDQPGYFHFGLLQQLALPLHHQPIRK